MNPAEPLKEQARAFFLRNLKEINDEDTSLDKIEALIQALQAVDEVVEKPIRPGTLDKYFVPGVKQAARDKAREAAIGACFALLKRWAFPEYAYPPVGRGEVEHVEVCDVVNCDEDQYSVRSLESGQLLTFNRLKDGKGHPMDTAPERGTKVTIIVRSGDLLNGGGR